MLKTILTAAILAIVPILASAQCQHQEAMSCAEGMVLDPETGIFTATW